ncbi:L,D-transpeptidase family protein [Pelagibacterium luteolum]|uniref:Murein L,D-transpeptidase YcbB/YkuD n=1 Tax=Pelagibacterium luteolum TaxID=440168 RepID=A0A1G7WUH1_9HYPH|nr:L,D-transpeptidase family protein [Pelagibacterium luteolum]SDG75582.1 Murein L,D-transpeptidase YcbB/YkuD [Pelagibacterium luteolum]
MKRLIVGAIAGASLFAMVSAATAFETVRVGEVNATRIMIAPPQTDLAKTIRDGLRDALDGAGNSRAQSDAQQLYYFYGARHFEPLWLTEDRGEIAFSSAAESVIALFEDAHLQGLEPSDYLTRGLDVAAAGSDPARLAALEAEFSAAMLRYATDAYTGRLDPRTVSENIDVAPKSVDEAELFSALAESADPAAVLMSYHPDHPEFIALRDLLGQHYSGEIEDRAPIGGGSLIRLGGSDARVPALRERMGTTSLPGADPLVYDGALEAAIEKFQGEMGLNPDGVVGPATVAAINGAGGATRADIVANMERWRWMPDDLGDFNVFVNIPQYRVEVVRYGETVWDSRTVVGTERRQTPVFSDQIRHVVTNPYWNVPPTILSQDVMPRVAANPNYLASQNMELFFNGAQIDPWMVDWSLANPNAFRVRQRPGPSNALGRVKFLFPNTHDVYLHDTNSPGLFSRSMRALSSGCVRVEDPFGFAEALLEFEPNLTVASLENTLGGNERWFNMDRRVPVHLAYFTLRVDENGTVRSFGDVYGHNAKTMEMLGV